MNDLVSQPIDAFLKPRQKPFKFKKPKELKPGEIAAFELVDNQDRAKLSEGRNYGFAGAFCKREGNVLTTVMPITCCKDFYNDLIYTELTGKPFSAYGLHTEKQNIFNHGEGYLVNAILKQGRNLTEYSNYNRDYEYFENNYQNLEKFINWFEMRFELPNLTKLIRLEENRILSIVPMFWCKATYRISLYSFLLRLGLFYKNGEPMEYLRKFNYDSSDVYMLNAIKGKLEKMLDGCIPEQNMNTISNIHNCGIQSFPFPA